MTGPPARRALASRGRAGSLRLQVPGRGGFDLELIGSRTLDGHTQELVYRPTLHA
ncbi:hypothetical protein ACFQY7_04095 [Actinomadura luteofluorescens]|uniref:hypothetical protein n=1 Tax=Actinomadura luteofluorescens TaxID=46163 RepID=UPI00363A5DA4